jgi:hypothetical protein
MKPQYKRKMVPALGVDNALVPNLGGSEIVLNCRYDDRGGWSANMGTENWYNFKTGFTLPTYIDVDGYFNSPVDSCYQWKPSNSNTIYTFVEQDGRLYYMLGNKNAGIYPSDFYTIQTDRHIRKNSEIGTQYVNLGKSLLIINGYDNAILFSGDRVWRQFGFTNPTGTPDALDVETEYESNTEELQGGTAIWFGANSTLGLGRGDSKASQYSWKITNVSDTGSESPLSGAETLTWTSRELLYAPTVELPLGPEGTVARRIYRTKNIPDFGEIFYFEKQIQENTSRWYVSYIPDTFLQTPAPSQLDSITIATDYQFGDVWDGRLWLAKDNIVIYSKQGLFEQFGAADYFDVSNLTGGSITGIKSYYNNLIIFRETAVNVISGTGNGYQISTINSSIGTTATNTITLVPKLGIVFMNQSGVWRLSGGLNGGSSINIEKLSHKIDQTLQDINRSMIHRAVAAYSPAEEIVWFHYADSVNTIPNRGCMLHMIPQIPQWSLFGYPDNDEKVYYPSLTTTLDGYFLMGTAQQWTGGGPKIVGSTTDQFGPLQVLSYSNYFAQTVTVQSDDDIYTYTVTDGDTVPRTWESAWYNFEDNSARHRVYSVEVEIMSMGDTSFDFYYQTDYQYEINNTTNQKQAKSDTVFTVNENPVFGPADATVTKVPFTIGQSRVTNGTLIHLRYDVNTGLINQFKWGISGKLPFHVVSYNLLYDTVELPVLNQSTNLKRGQSR